LKEIKLIIEDDVYRDLKNSIFARKLAANNSGLQDAAIDKIINAINDDEKKITLQYKNKR
jgi:hypothetical protein